MYKKAELTISTVVVIVIALLVMITLIYVFFNTSDSWGEAAACSQAGGRCMPMGSCPGNEIQEGMDSCSGNTPVCCPIGS